MRTMLSNPDFLPLLSLNYLPSLRLYSVSNWAAGFPSRCVILRESLSKLFQFVGVDCPVWVIENPWSLSSDWPLLSARTPKLQPYATTAGLLRSNQLLCYSDLACVWKKWLPLLEANVYQPSQHALMPIFRHMGSIWGVPEDTPWKWSDLYDMPSE